MGNSRRTALWLGLGSLLLTGAAASGPAHAAEPADSLGYAPPQPATAIQLAAAAMAAEPAGGEGAEGGEGGEGGVFYGTSKDERFAARLALMRGHLRVGKELYDAGHADVAVDHFLHPLEEVYEAIEEALEEAGVSPYEDRFKELAEAARAGDDPGRVRDLYAQTLAGIEASAEAVAGGAREEPGFVLDVVRVLLKKAAAEYDAAVDDGSFVDAHEYQDSRGFALVAGDLLRSLRPRLAGTAAQQYAELRAEYDELVKAWPSVLPPDAPVMTASAVYGAMSRTELAMTGVAPVGAEGAEGGEGGEGG